MWLEELHHAWSTYIDLHGWVINGVNVTINHPKTLKTNGSGRLVFTHWKHQTREAQTERSVWVYEPQRERERELVCKKPLTWVVLVGGCARHEDMSGIWAAFEIIWGTCKSMRVSSGVRMVLLTPYAQIGIMTSQWIAHHIDVFKQLEKSICSQFQDATAVISATSLLLMGHKKYLKLASGIMYIYIYI